MQNHHQIRIMSNERKPTLRAQIRKKVAGELPLDAPLVFEKPVFKTDNATSLKDIRSDWAEVMLQLAKNGKGVTSFLVHLDISPEALNKLLRDEPEFRNHYQKCLFIQKEYLENAGLGMVNGKPGNAKVWAMFMTNISGWKSENTRQEIVGDAQSPLVIKKQILDNATKEELKAYADYLRNC